MAKQPEKKKPLTREDVIRKIEEIKGPHDWVNLSDGEFLYKIDLRGLNLHGFILKNANLAGANLQGVDLSFAHLEGADLSFAHLEGADLSFAHLEGADLFSAELSPDTKLADVKWENYVLDETKKWRLGPIENPYRRLKIWYTNAGMYDIAAEFYYREMEARRKSLKWRSQSTFRHRLALEMSRLFFGYGERWNRILIWMAAVLFGLAGAYHLWGSFSSSSFLDTLYYSAVSFTALGYGQWAPQPTGWAKALGAAEAFIGVSMMALLLVTFVRKWTR